MKITNIEGKALVTAYNSQFVQKSNVYKQCRNNIEFSIIHYAGQVMWDTILVTPDTHKT